MYGGAASARVLDQDCAANMICNRKAHRKPVSRVPAVRAGQGADGVRMEHIRKHALREALARVTNNEVGSVCALHQPYADLGMVGRTAERVGQQIQHQRLKQLRRDAHAAAGLRQRQRDVHAAAVEHRLNGLHDRRERRSAVDQLTG